MAQTAEKITRAGSKGGGTIRATISFPSDVYRSLEDIARQKKVSVAWVVREASEQYVTDRWPLFRSGT